MHTSAICLQLMQQTSPECSHSVFDTGSLNWQQCRSPSHFVALCFFSQARTQVLPGQLSGCIDCVIATTADEVPRL